MDKIKVTKKMKKKIDLNLQYFYSQTMDGYIIHYLNGFIGVGILEEPENHLHCNMNTIWIYGCGHTDDGKDIEENHNVYLTEDEGRDLLKCLMIALPRHHKYYVRQTEEQRMQNMPRKLRVPKGK